MNGHRRRDHVYSGPSGTPEPIYTRPRRITRSGITRRQPTTPSQPPPLTALQRHVLALLTPEPQRAITLVKQGAHPADGVRAALYSLQARGLAVNQPGRGWRQA